MNCVKCGGKKFVETSVHLAQGIKAKAWKCTRCGEMLIEPSAAQRALLLNKLKHGTEVTVGQLGNSLVMRFPADITSVTGLKKGSKVKVYAEDDDKLTVVPC